MSGSVLANYTPTVAVFLTVKKAYQKFTLDQEIQANQVCVLSHSLKKACTYNVRSSNNVFKITANDKETEHHIPFGILTIEDLTEIVQQFCSTRSIDVQYNPGTNRFIFTSAVDFELAFQGETHGLLLGFAPDSLNKATLKNSRYQLESDRGIYLKPPQLIHLTVKNAASDMLLMETKIEADVQDRLVYQRENLYTFDQQPLKTLSVRLHDEFHNDLDIERDCTLILEFSQ